tara:strand:- start:205 stop:432 length:228 start_codon:yes stop_codon:yes gene_type:complete
MKPAIKHPFGGVIYQLESDGTVNVSDGNRSGIFDSRGVWISGDLREADPQMCVWICNQPPPPEELESSWTLSQEN